MKKSGGDFLKSMLVRVLLFFYLTSAYLGATHIHHDGLESMDCKVHILVKNLNSADTPIVDELLFLCEGCYKTLFTSRYIWVVSISKGFNAQAPPTLS